MKNNNLEKEVFEIMNKDETPISVLDKALNEMRQNKLAKKHERYAKIKKYTRFAIPILVPLIVITIILSITLQETYDHNNKKTYSYSDLIKTPITSIKEDSDFLYIDADFIEYANKLYDEDGNYILIEEKGKLDEYLYLLSIVSLYVNVPEFAKFEKNTKYNFVNDKLIFSYSKDFNLITFKDDTYYYYIYNYTSTYESMMKICTNIVENQS